VKPQFNKETFIVWRFNFVVVLICLIVIALMIRLMELAVFKKNFLQTESNARVLRVVTQPAFRGMIVDRVGYPLAISASVYSVWVNPQEFSNKDPNLLRFSKLLIVSKENLLRIIMRAKTKQREFVYIKRDLSPELAKKIKLLKISGVYLEAGSKRFYPEGEVASHVIGFTNIDDQGQEGLELQYNQWLAGKPGKKIVIKDRLGRVIDDVKTLQANQPGHDLSLSIDHRVQYLAYRELLSGVEENKAASGSVVVLDIKTGEILAMVNLPSYNPNNRMQYASPNIFRNRAVTDVFEPGSTIKSFSIASGLDSKQYTANTVINTSPGWLMVGHHLVRDEHNKGPLTLTQILQYSSNVGNTKMLLSLPPDELWSLLHRVGFGEITGIGFPGERAGELAHHTDVFELATLGFGYGLSVTALQLAAAYSVFADHGIKLPLSLIHLDSLPKGERVLDQSVADQMLKLLESVVSEKGGTGRPAQIPGYRVAGKTGTSWMVGKNGYEKHHYVSSFVGIAPISQPRFVVAVVIHDPQGKNYLGGYVSGPIFKKIMEGLLHQYNVPPDQSV